MNAGCYGQEISSNLVECTIISSNGNMLTRKKKEISSSGRELAIALIVGPFIPSLRLRVR